MEAYTSVLLPILFDAALTLAAIAAVIGVLTSLWLLLFPDSFAKFEAAASRSFSLRRTLRPLEISRNIDRHIYRHHKLFGLLVILASTYTIYSILFSMPSRIDTFISVRFPPLAAEWILNTLNLFLLLGNLFAIIIGLVIHTRPSALKDFEARANRWVTLRRQTRWLENRIPFPERLTRTQPRLTGFVLLIFSIYLMSLVSII